MLFIFSDCRPCKLHILFEVYRQSSVQLYSMTVCVVLFCVETCDRDTALAALVAKRKQQQATMTGG